MKATSSGEIAPLNLNLAPDIGQGQCLIFRKMKRKYKVKYFCDSSCRLVAILVRI